MSQRSRTVRSSQQANSSRSIIGSQRESQRESQTQTQSQRQSVAVSESLVQKCVRLFLIKMGTNVPIKRSLIVQQLFKERPGKAFDIVIQQASQILQQVYGLKLRIIDEDTANKKYILTNYLDKPELISDSLGEDLKVTITFLVLTHIFMGKDSATEASLWEFLNGVNIVPETEIPDVGNVQTFVTKQLVKEQYIQLEAIGAANEDGEIKKRFSWGSRAEECVSKMDILKFVAKMYGNVNLNFWSSRYEDAVRQSSENTDDMEITIDE